MSSPSAPRNASVSESRIPTPASRETSGVLANSSARTALARRAQWGSGMRDAEVPARHPAGD